MAKKFSKVDTKKLRKLAKEMPERLDAAGRGAVAQMTAEIVTSFNSSPPGERYGNHIASQPGYPPNIDTGVLRASINWKAQRRLVYWIGDGTKYGAFLEFGTPTIAPRPFLSPVFEAWYRNRLMDWLRDEGLFKV